MGTSTGQRRTGGANVLMGTVFSLSVGLGPFVETQPTSGKVGAAVKILGTNLTGATSVTFNGTAAVFKVVSSSEITTTVPAGATTGKVQVVTPHGTLFEQRALPGAALESALLADQRPGGNKGRNHRGGLHGGDKSDVWCDGH